MILVIWDAFSKLLASNYPGVFVTVVLLILAWLLVTRWERLYGRFKHTESQVTIIVEKELPEIRSDIRELKSDVNTLKSDVNTLKIDVATLKSDVRTILTILQKER